MATGPPKLRVGPRVFGPLSVLLLALIFPRLSVIQTILLLPAFLATVIVTLVVLAIIWTSRREKEEARPTHLARQRNALRRFSFTTSSAWSAVLTRQSWEESPDPSWRIPVRHMTSTLLSKRLDALFDLIKTHFILPWHDRISPSPAFPNAVEVLIRQCMSQIIQGGEVIDWPDVIVANIVPRLTDHLHHFRTIEHLASTTASPLSHASLPLPLPRKIHPALAGAAHVNGQGSSPTIEAHLRRLVKRLLAHALPEQEKTEVVDTIVTEVVLGTIMLPIFDMLCDGDFWNRQIDEKGGRYLREQNQVNKFLSALATLQQPLVTPSPTRSKHPTASRSVPPASSISVHSSTKHFDAFIRSIPKLKTLGEARRLKADVERELRSIVATGSSDGSERDTQRRERYVRRLEKAKGLIDDRIAALAGQEKSSGLLSPRLPPSTLSTGHAPQTDLYTVLADPSSMAYFLEFMERRYRARLVQFWLTVEGFKDPLEAAGRDSAVNITSQLLPDEARTSDNTTIAEDASFLYLAYITQDEGKTALQIPSRHRVVIRDFAENLAPGAAISIGDVRKTKHAMFAAQRSVFEQMEEDDWPDFQRSELFLKAIANLETGSARTSRALPPLAQPALINKPRLSAVPPPPPPRRQNTAPAPFSATSGLASPLQRPVPRLVNGSFPSAALVSDPTLSMSPTQSARVASDGASSAGRPTRATSEEPLKSGRDQATPGLHRGSSHFDVLMADTTPKERDPLFDQEEDGDEADDEYIQVQRMEAIQAALNEIIASDDMTASRMSETGRDVGNSTPGDSASLSASMISLGAKPYVQHDRLASRSVEDLSKPTGNPHFISAPHSRQTSGKAGTLPTLAERRSLSNFSPTHERPSRHLFDDDLSVDGEADDQPQPAVDDNGDHQLDDIVQLAEPGNLYLGVEIGRLQEKLQELVRQENVLETLIRQAELTGNQAELRILNRSLSSVRRETRTSIFQKAQYEQQEEENRLEPGKTRVTIPRHIDTSEDGKQVVRYIVRIEQSSHNSDGAIGSSALHWDVARRYNDFHELDKSVRDVGFSTQDRGMQQELRKKIPELPGKKIAPVLSSAQLDSRRSGLERYLQALVSLPVICNSPVLRAFLSRTPGHQGTLNDTAASVANLTSLAPQNLVRSLYKTMATSLDDAMFGPSMLDLMYTSLSRQLSDVTGLVGMGSDELVGLLPQAIKSGWVKDSQSPSSSALPLQSAAEETAASIFTAPICDLCVELFDLKENKNNWLRRQAIVVIIQQFLGNTIERKVRESFRSSHSPTSIETLLSSIQEILFPDGQRRPPSDARTDAEKHETKMRASKKIGMLMPDVIANMIGRGNARRAARRVFSALQDTRLNQQLVLCILDDIFDVLFPPAPGAK